MPFRPSFGTDSQIQFANEAEFYRALGYLAKSNGTTALVWERNQEQNAWGNEGRIHFMEVSPRIAGNFRLTAGRPGVAHRTNCNEFVREIVESHAFVYGSQQNIAGIMQTIPVQFHVDFQQGLAD